ncbi:MAG: response regulator transcription factor [Propionicimonas sp.]|uniref:response regulator n=1 Tax=Propionicimonas sp. TaxID=1955623 RepID=UPI003D124C87
MADAHHDPTQPNAMIKVFIVDDDLYVRSNLSELLPRFGAFEVTGVLADGADAVAAAAVEPPDVILMDITMPGMDGIEATRRIFRDAPQVKILALTSLPEPAMVARMQAAGAAGYLFKDTPVPAMARAIEAAHLGLAVMSPQAVAGPPAERPDGLPHLNQMEMENPRPHLPGPHQPPDRKTGLSRAVHGEALRVAADGTDGRHQPHHARHPRRALPSLQEMTHRRASATPGTAPPRIGPDGR